MKQKSDFTRLRTLLGEEPSRKAFKDILGLFRCWEDEESKSVGVEYSLGHLASWPDMYREATLKECWPHFPEGVPVNYFMLVRSLNVGACEIGAGGVKVLANTPALDNLTMLNCYRSMMGNEGLKALASSSHLHSNLYLQNLVRISGLQGLLD